MTPSRRKPRSAANRSVLPPEVPETVKADVPATASQATDSDLLPDDLRKMLEAAYT